MADQIHKVLTMSPEESARRWEIAFNHVKTHDATNWVNGFLGELKDAYIEQQRGVPTVLPKLNVEAYSRPYTTSDRRLFVIDYEGIRSVTILISGTLVAWASGPGIVLTTQPKVISILNDLAADPRNVVFVMSGETTSVDPSWTH
jgi:trehalose 6-phosphate synthase/phosphatase